MSSVLPHSVKYGAAWLPKVLLGAVGAAFLCILAPTVLTLSKQIWHTDEQGHGPIIGAISLWLMWRRRHEFMAAPDQPAYAAGVPLLLLALVMHAIGRSQKIIQVEVLGVLLTGVALLLLTRGAKGLRLMAFPLLFLLFLVPLPGVLVQAITLPLKMAVSYVAEAVLHFAGYPIGRTGVILTIGQYQLLVADACAGLNSLFTLEALGLLYLNLMGYTDRTRNLLLSILVVPISFIANVIRVLILVLVTYYLGDEAGQGFVHTFAGMVLFIVGLAMMLATDGVVGRLLGQTALPPVRPASSGAASWAWAMPAPAVAVFSVLIVLSAIAGEWLRPGYRLSEHKARILLAQQVPEAFGGWKIDSSMMPVVPDPSMQAALDALYSQTLARTYVNASGQRVMLSIAYGSDQSNEATAVHRPEFCYSAQGFRVRSLGNEVLDIKGTAIPAARVVASLGQRNEPITYWVTLDEAATLPGLGRKLQQLRYGLRGQIPDGMLIRVSTISQSLDQSFALQQRFVEQMFAAVPPDVRARYFGAARSTAKVALSHNPG